MADQDWHSISAEVHSGMLAVGVAELLMPQVLVEKVELAVAEMGYKKLVRHLQA
jgi:hypothetical protein